MVNALAKAGIELGENGYLPEAEGEASLAVHMAYIFSGESQKVLGF